MNTVIFLIVGVMVGVLVAMSSTNRSAAEKTKDTLTLSLHSKTSLPAVINRENKNELVKK